MNAITEAPVARQSLTSQTGFATIDTEKAAPERMRPTMAWQIDGKTVVPSPVGSSASSQPCHRWPRRTPRPRATRQSPRGSVCTWLSEDQQAT